MHSPQNLRCGPAGWSYPHWNSTVYPRPKPRGFHELEYLAGFFNVVEINTSFYQPLRAEISRLWLKKVSHNADFVFTAKLYRGFTHDRTLDASQVQAFKDGLWPLVRAGKLGALLMQFPWSFRFTEENRDFVIRLRRTFHEFPLVVEMRHDSWMFDEALGVLMDYRLGFCNVDQPQYAHAMPPADVVTSRIGYVRMHGRSSPEWRREWVGQAVSPATGRRNRLPHPANQYLYSPVELEEWKARIDNISAQASTVFVIMNNDAGGKSVVNALQLQAMLGEPRREAPGGLLRHYPCELGDFSCEQPLQEELFQSVA